MKVMYFARHGETVWNADRKVCGLTDVELTEKGHEQAKALGERIRREGIRIDEICCSPLRRAWDTAQHIAEITGIPVRVIPQLREQDFGKFEGTDWTKPAFDEAKRNLAYSFGGGESMFRVAQRIYNVLDELKKDDKIYLIVAHNGVVRAVNSYFHDLTNEEFSTFRIENCDLLRYAFEGNGFADQA